MIARVASLHIYPVKSCAGFEVDAFQVGARGPLHDREWMIVDHETHDFLTQRQLPALTQVKTAISESALNISLPNSKFSVPLELTQGPAMPVTIWKETCLAQETDPHVSEAMSDLLQRRVRFVRIAPTFKRKRFSKYDRHEAHTGFADGYPLLLASMDSLADLNSRLTIPVPMNRFRANIVVEGAAPFAEDQWRGLTIGELKVDVVKPCERCVIITTEQDTGKRGHEPLKTLATYRRNESGKVIFGQNLLHSGEGLVRKGDHVLER